MTQLLDESSKAALDAKERGRAEIEASFDELEAEPPVAEKALLSHYDDLHEGDLINGNGIRLHWVSPDWFEYQPVAGHEFAFRRTTGETIRPRRMFTDGGSIPRLFWSVKNLSPWGYAPAYLIHDFEFDLHHCNLSTKSFEEVTITMLEVVKTLMEQGICPKSLRTFEQLYLAVNSSIARKAWNKVYPTCPLP